MEEEEKVRCPRRCKVGCLFCRHEKTIPKWEWERHQKTFLGPGVEAPTENVPCPKVCNPTLGCPFCQGEGEIWPSAWKQLQEKFRVTKQLETLEEKSMSMKARAFKMVRNADETGVSGTGVVGDGIEFPNGMVSFCWRSKTPSVNIYRSFPEFREIHITKHPSNDTEVHWYDLVEAEIDE